MGCEEIEGHYRCIHKKRGAKWKCKNSLHYTPFIYSIDFAKNPQNKKMISLSIDFEDKRLELILKMLDIVVFR